LSGRGKPYKIKEMAFLFNRRILRTSGGCQFLDKIGRKAIIRQNAHLCSEKSSTVIPGSKPSRKKTKPKAFALSSNFISKFAEKPPQFGFNGLGYLPMYMHERELFTII
jgi:hypothetical protein